MKDNADLIERLEKAPGGSQELNAEVWLATRVKWSKRQFAHWSGVQPKGKQTTEREYARDRAPNFTGSIDSALMLLPKGWSGGLEDAGIADKVKRPLSYCWPFNELWEPDWMLGEEGYRSHPAAVQGVGATRALSICIAALKARARAHTKGE